MNKLWSTLLAGAVGGLVTFGAIKFTEQPQEPQAPAQSLAKQVNYEYGGGPAGVDFTRAAEHTMETVVHIKAAESRQNAIQRQRQTNPFRFFFGDDFFNFDDYSQPRAGTGSGVIYTTDGYILTNNHVVENADEYTVTLHDNREFKARLIGADPSTDMAVLKIDAADLPAIELGNSDAVKVGEWVLAVGNPFDLTSTVTAGIISAKSRDINIIRRGAAIESFIQTDAAVNPGNSGGALVDINGRLIGINSAIATPTGTFAGYSFAIPVNLAKRIADDLIKYGKYKRAYLGVDIATMDSNLANELNIPVAQGVWIKALDPQGSAARSGVQPDDVIVKVNGKNISTVPELQEVIGRSRAGETVALTLVRNGKEKTVEVKLKSRGEE
ncbi:MAG: trypsin-like peptidase domain-containing protein [Saprospiraceae bacterium]